MKKIIGITVIALVMTLGSGLGSAQTKGGQPMMGGGEQQMQPGMMMGGGKGPCKMMGGGMGMGAGMMGGNMGMGPGMMMGGGMGPCMMCNMMGGPMGMMTGTASSAEYEKFMKETSTMRRKLHDLRFDYQEAMWKPETTMKELRKMMDEMRTLQEQIQQKMPH